MILQVNSAKNLKEGKTHMGHGPDTYVTVTCGQESFVSDTAMQVRKGILKPLISSYSSTVMRESHQFSDSSLFTLKDGKGSGFYIIIFSVNTTHTFTS